MNQQSGPPHSPTPPPVEAEDDEERFNQVRVKDVLGTKILSVKSRWLTTLPVVDSRWLTALPISNNMFRTWEFLVIMIKASLDPSCHQGFVRDDKSGAEVDQRTEPTPGEYRWILNGALSVLSG
jgi:hypothetical protein